MGLVELAVSIANGVTLNLGLQSKVSHESFTNETGSGARQFASPIVRDAIVTLKQQMVKNADGQLEMAQAKIVILDPTVRVKLQDRFTLADGTTGPVLAVEGFVPKGADRPPLTQVWLG